MSFEFIFVMSLVLIVLDKDEIIQTVMLTVKSLGYEFLQRRKRDVPTIRMFRVWK